MLLSGSVCFGFGDGRRDNQEALPGGGDQPLMFWIRRRLTVNNRANVNLRKDFSLPCYSLSAQYPISAPRTNGFSPFLGEDSAIPAQLSPTSMFLVCALRSESAESTQDLGAGGSPGWAL